MQYVFVVGFVVLWCIVLCNIFLTLALVRQVNRLSGPKERVREPGLKAGEQAPSFSASTLEGETATLADYHGTTTALIFLSAHCKPCRALLPELKLWGTQAQNAGVNLVVVSSDDLEATSAMLEENDLRLPTLIAPRAENPFFTDYHISGTPSYCVLDEQGVVQSTGHPSLLFGEWKTFVTSQLKAQPKVEIQV